MRYIGNRRTAITQAELDALPDWRNRPEKVRIGQVYKAPTTFTPREWRLVEILPPFPETAGSMTAMTEFWTQAVIVKTVDRDKRLAGKAGK